MRSQAHLAPICPWVAASHLSSGLIGSISHSLQTASVQRSEKTQLQAATIPHHSQHCVFCSLPQKGECRTITAFPAPYVLAGMSATCGSLFFCLGPTTAGDMRSNVSKTSNSPQNFKMLLFIFFLYHYLLF